MCAFGAHAAGVAFQYDPIMPTVLMDGVPPDVVEGLKKLGHKTTSLVSPLGGGQGIWIDWEKGTLTGGSDPRKDGCALGY